MTGSRLGQGRLSTRRAITAGAREEACPSPAVAPSGRPSYRAVASPVGRVFGRARISLDERGRPCHGRASERPPRPVRPGANRRRRRRLSVPAFTAVFLSIYSYAWPDGWVNGPAPKGRGGCSRSPLRGRSAKRYERGRRCRRPSCP